MLSAKSINLKIVLILIGFMLKGYIHFVEKTSYHILKGIKGLRRGYTIRKINFYLW